MRVLLALATAAAVATGSLAAFAASDGTPGATSTGSLDVTLTIPHLVRITGLDDIPLVHAAEGDITGSDSFCVNDNLSATGRGYTIKASSANGSGSDFRMLTTGPLYLVYDVDFDDDSDAGTGGTDLDHNVTSPTEFDSGAAVNMGSSCTSPNASVLITVTEAAHQAAQAGSYSDTLTLLITAD